MFEGWPGEKLVTKMWVTLTEKGIGGLLKPGQIEREANAAMQTRRRETLLLAQTDIEAEMIRRGELTVSQLPKSLTFAPSNATPDVVLKERVEPTIDLNELARVAETRAVLSGMRKEVNVARAIQEAEHVLADDPTPAPERDVDADWLFRWREGAGEVSSEEMQAVWGSLLAGEVKAPGAFSLRTLDLIRNLTSEEAKLIEKAVRLMVANWLWRSDDTSKYGITFDELLALQDIGIISGVESLGMDINIAGAPGPHFETVLTSHNLALLIRRPEREPKLTFGIYSFTKSGREIAKLMQCTADPVYVRDLGSRIAASGFSVHMGPWTALPDGRISILQPTEISPP